MTLEFRPRVRAINFSDDREFRPQRPVSCIRHWLSAVSASSVTMSADFVRDGTLTNALEDTGFTEVDAERDRTIYGLEWAAATSEYGTFADCNQCADGRLRRQSRSHHRWSTTTMRRLALSYAHIDLSERSTFTASPERRRARHDCRLSALQKTYGLHARVRACPV